MRKKNYQTQWGFLGNLGVGAKESSASLLGSRVRVEGASTVWELGLP